MNAPAPLSLHQQKVPATPRARVKAMLNRGTPLRKVVVESGVKDVDVKAWLDGTSVEEIDNRMVAWLEDTDQAESERNELPRVKTSITQGIEAVFEQARLTPTIGAVVTPPGAGKSTTCQDCIDAARGGEHQVFYFAANPFIKSATAAIFKLAEAMQNSGHGIGNLTARAYRAYQLAQAIAEHLRYGDLILVDEAQHLEAAALDALRAFYDETRCGIVFLGNPALYTRLSGSGRRAEFAQLHSRIGCRMVVTKIDERDIDAVLEAYEVKGVAERQFLHQIGGGPGGLRQLANVVRQSRIAAQEMKLPLDVQVLRASAELLGVV